MHEAITFPRIALLPLQLGLLLAACRPADEQMSAERTIGPEGGEIVLPDGFALRVEPGALHEPTSIAVTRLDSTFAGTGNPSFEYRLEPDGLVFDIPAEMDIPYPDEGEVLDDMRMWVQNDRAVTAVEVLGRGTISFTDGSADGFVTGAVHHFSTFCAGVPQRDWSSCWWPVGAQNLVEGLNCSLQGGDPNGVRWGINEWGAVGHREPDGTCGRPNTAVTFAVHEPRIWILQSWEVSNAINVASQDVGVEDLAFGALVRAIRPYSPGFDWRAAGSMLPGKYKDPYWQAFDFSVWPEDSGAGMYYDFKLTLLDPITGEINEVEGSYDSRPYATECDCPRAWPSSCEEETGTEDDGGGTSGGTEPVQWFQATVNGLDCVAGSSGPGGAAQTNYIMPYINDESMYDIRTAVRCATDDGVRYDITARLYPLNAGEMVAAGSNDPDDAYTVEFDVRTPDDPSLYQLGAEDTGTATGTIAADAQTGTLTYSFRARNYDGVTLDVTDARVDLVFMDF